MNRGNKFSKTSKPQANRGKRPTKRPKDDDQTKSSGSGSIHSYNDPQWYTVAGQLVKDVGSLSFNNKLGDTIFLNSTIPSKQINLPAFPGICTIYTTPAVGVATNNIAGVNVAAKNLYSWIVHWNSRNTKYNSPDMMMYFLAMDQVYSCLSWLIRLYGIARTFSQTNKYIGAALLTANGVDADNIYQNLSNFRAYINMAITKAGTMCVPATMTYFLRHVWMYTNVYRDENIAKSSLYMYVPAFFWKLDATASTALVLEPAACRYMDTAEQSGIVTNTGLSWYQLRLMLDNILNPIIANEDMNMISGDVLKAFGKEGLFGMGLIAEDYATVPVYSEEVLQQIHNTNFVGNSPTNAMAGNSIDSLKVIQDTSVGEGNLMFVPMFKNCDALTYTHILDFYKEDPTPEDVITATRNMVFMNGDYDPTTNVFFGAVDSCGSEIPLFGNVWYFSSSTGLLTSAGIFTDGWVSQTNTTQISRNEKFNYFPLGLIKQNSTNLPNAITGDIGNYTSIDSNTLKKMHDTAILSMFGVPLLGNAARG